jgi:hypothetical protein
MENGVLYYGNAVLQDFNQFPPVLEVIDEKGLYQVVLRMGLSSLDGECGWQVVLEVFNSYREAQEYIEGFVVGKKRHTYSIQPVGYGYQVFCKGKPVSKSFATREQAEYVMRQWAETSQEGPESEKTMEHVSTPEIIAKLREKKWEMERTLDELNDRGVRVDLELSYLTTAHLNMQTIEDV